MKLKDVAVFSPPVRDDDQLRPVAAALAVDPRRPDREQGARQDPGRGADDVETGQSLSAALAKHPQVFPPLIVNMVRAGEVGGFLDAVMLQIAENYEAEVKLRGKIKSAMTYPVVVFVHRDPRGRSACCCSSSRCSRRCSRDLGGTLPLPTQILVDLSDGAAVHGTGPRSCSSSSSASSWRRVRHTEQVRQRRRPDQAQDAGLRPAVPEGRDLPVHPQLRARC